MIQHNNESEEPMYIPNMIESNNHRKTSYNKMLTYGKYNINIGVKLNAIIERRPGGKIFHTIICNDLGTNYYRKYEACGLVELKNIIRQAENDARLWVNLRENPLFEEEEFLKDSGFI